MGEIRSQNKWIKMKASAISIKYRVAEAFLCLVYSFSDYRLITEITSFYRTIITKYRTVYRIYGTVLTRYRTVLCFTRQCPHITRQIYYFTGQFYYFIKPFRQLPAYFLKISSGWNNPPAIALIFPSIF